MLALKRVGCEESNSSIGCSFPISILAVGQRYSYPSQRSVPLNLLGRKAVGVCLDVTEKSIDDGGT